MARLTLSFLLAALSLASSTSAVTHHPGADVLGWGEAAKRDVGRVGHAGSNAVSTTPSGPAARRHRRAARGAKRAVDANEARALEPVPEPAKRDLNTPNNPANLATLKVERAHPAFGELEGRGVHPQVFLQQHINRGVRRHAKMTGRSAVEDIDAHNEEQIRKRWIGIYGHDGDLKIAKRQRGGLAAASVAEPAVQVNQAAETELTNAFKGEVDTNEAAAGKGFSQARLDALEKGTVTPPGKVTADNTLGLSIEAADVGYFATVQVGTPPKNFKVLMDSGSADFWVAGENCKTCGNHQTLGTAASSTFVQTNKQFQVTYGTGNVAGNIIQDTVTIAGLTLNNHTFGANTQESQDFGSNQVPFDSLMGLAQSTLSNQKVLTPIESLAKQKLVSAAQMGFTLGRVGDASNTGEVSFGGIDQTKVVGGQLTVFKNVNTQGFWEGAMDDITVNGKSVNLAGRTAILDTGTTLIVAPQADAEAIHAAIPGSKTDGQGGFSVPCTTSAKVALKFGGKSFAINPTDLTFQPLTNNLQGDCLSGISSGQIGGAKEWLVGDVFLKNVVFATDVDANSIGLGVAKAAA